MPGYSTRPGEILPAGVQASATRVGVLIGVKSGRRFRRNHRFAQIFISRNQFFPRYRRPVFMSDRSGASLPVFGYNLPSIR